MTSTSAAALFTTMLILAVAPGPSDFAVVARAIAAGFKQAALMVVGIVIADFLFIVLAIYSLSEIAESMSGLFTVVKYLCGAYLIWSGVTALRSRSAETSATETSTKGDGFSSLIGGFLITLGDPKAIVFYMGLFPAYVDVTKISLADTITIMLIATVVICSVKLTYAYLAGRAKRLFESSGFGKTMNVIAGVVLIATGGWLVGNG
ncbi:MAG: LysE family translocator [Planctomycetota bacterium]|nr:LysE family translocator [Planctomycetota bacterium]MDA1214449.1 LysE family translocator [Planctomycetota bacterium]